MGHAGFYGVTGRGNAGFFKTAFRRGEGIVQHQNPVGAGFLAHGRHGFDHQGVGIGGPRRAYRKTHIGFNDHSAALFDKLGYAAHHFNGFSDRRLNIAFYNGDIGLVLGKQPGGAKMDAPAAQSMPVAWYFKKLRLFISFIG